MKFILCLLCLAYGCSLSKPYLYGDLASKVFKYSKSGINIKPFKIKLNEDGLVLKGNTGILPHAIRQRGSRRTSFEFAKGTLETCEGDKWLFYQLKNGGRDDNLSFDYLGSNAAIRRAIVFSIEGPNIVHRLDRNFEAINIASVISIGLILGTLVPLFLYWFFEEYLLTPASAETDIPFECSAIVQAYLRLTFGHFEFSFLDKCPK